MVQDPGYVPGLTRPISVSEYAQLKGMREAEVFAGIRALKIPSAFSRGQWYVEAPRNCEARLAQLRGGQQPHQSEDVTSCTQNTKTNEQIQRDSEAERLRARIDREMPVYDTLTDSEKKTLLKITDYAEVPQPIDYGLTFGDLTRDDEKDLAGNDWAVTPRLKYKESKWRTETFLGILFAVCTATFLAYSILNQTVSLITLELGLTWLASAILVGFLPATITAYKRRHPSAGLLAFRQALRLHRLYLAAKVEAEEAARKAAHDAELRKRSYWTFLDGYAFEQATAEVLRRHQFTALDTVWQGGLD